MRDAIPQLTSIRSDTIPQHMHHARVNCPCPLPPAYEESPVLDNDVSNDSQQTEPPAPYKLHINASLTISGNNNIIATATPALTALYWRNAIQEVLRQDADRDIEVRVDCGVAVIGDRNVVGGTVAAAALMRGLAEKTGMRATAGTKRQREEDTVAGGDEVRVKREKPS